MKSFSSCFLCDFEDFIDFDISMLFFFLLNIDPPLTIPPRDMPAQDTPLAMPDIDAIPIPDFAPALFVSDLWE